MQKLCWNIYDENINRRRIESYNIFSHNSFMKDITKAYKHYKDSFVDFSNAVKKSLKYYFWGKCEWEIVLSDWPPSENFNKLKVDVYDQVTLNWDRFIEYVWNTFQKEGVIK